MNLGLNGKQDLLDTEEPQAYEIREARTHLLSSRIAYLDPSRLQPGTNWTVIYERATDKSNFGLDCDKRHEIHASGEFR